MMETTREKTNSFKLDLRHRSNMTPDKFIREYCVVFRPYAFATKDDSLNEFEKQITHVLGMNVYYKRCVEIITNFLSEYCINFNESFDPREIVWKIEEGTEQEVLELREKFKEIITILAKSFSLENAANDTTQSDKYGFVTTESCGDKIGKQIRLTEKKHNQFGYYNEGAILTISWHDDKLGYTAGVLISGPDKKFSDTLTIRGFHNEVHIGYDGFEFID